MKKLALVLFISMFCVPLAAQDITKVVDDFITATKELDSTEVKKENLADSVANLKRQLMQMQLNELTLRSALDSTNNNDEEYLRQKQLRIDSLRSRSVGVPLVVEGDTLFFIYANMGGVTANERVDHAAERIMEAGKRRLKMADSISIMEMDNLSEIMCGERVLFSVNDNDAIWVNSSRIELSQEMMGIIKSKVDEVREKYSYNQLIKRVVYFVLVLLAQFFLFKLTVYIYNRIKNRILRLADTKLRSVVVKDYEFLTKERQAKILIFVTLLVRYIVTAVQLVITIPILFSIFPQTESLAITIFSYIYIPIKAILNAILDYIPNIFIILIIYLFIKYIVKGLRYISGEIESGKLHITGFYPDWAKPSFSIIKFLLYAFMIAMIYPYLPGSSSKIFQGISVFVGVIVSLGSSTVIGNIMAGLVITYMRPFKIGDRIKLNDTVGNVTEKTPFVTRIRTPKNEIITIPNSFILSSHTVNYSASAQDYGLIIHSSVTIGYDAPWRTVHDLLIAAAKSTNGVSQTPSPFVLETELSDFYPVYQINAYISDADRIAQIYSDLHQNIQDKFNHAGVEIMSPHYRAGRDGNKSTIPSN